MVDVDTFLVIVYTLVDTLYQRELAPLKPRRRGHRPEMADSEILTLLLLGQWLGTSERGLLRYVEAHWAAAFPRRLHQSAFNRRVRDLGGACARLMQLLAQELGSGQAPYQVVDGVPVPLARRCRGAAHHLFANDAGLGRGGSDRDYYFGCSLLLAVADDGPITGFVLGPANTEGRWLLDALLSWRADPAAELWTVADIPTRRKRRQGYVGPTGPRWWPDSAGAYCAQPYLADGGFRGRAWQLHWRTDAGATVLTVDPDDDRSTRHRHQRWRQIIETVNAALDGTFHLAYPGAKTPWGLVTRIAAKCAAVNCAIWINRLLGRPDLAVDTLFAG